MILAIVVMLVSTLVYSTSYVLQHKGTVASMEATGQSGVKQLIKHPAWLVGAILFYVAGAIHLVALSLGSLAVVQALIVTELIFIPPVAAVISKIRVPRRDWMWILVVSLALAVFLAVGQPTEGNSQSSTTRWIITVGAMLIVFAICMIVGRGLSAAPRAAVLGTATGIINALYVVTAKGAMGGPEMLLLVVLIALAIFAAIGSVAFATYAFRSGPITVSSAAMIVVNPIVATVAAEFLFDVQITHTPVALAIIAVSVVAVILGIVQLSRSHAVHGEAEHSDPHHPISQPPGPLPD